MLAAGSRPSEFSRMLTFFIALVAALYAICLTEPPSQGLLYCLIAVGHQLAGFGSRWFETRPTGNRLIWIVAIIPAPVLWTIAGVRDLELASVPGTAVLVGAAAFAAMRLSQRLSQEDSDLCLRWSSRIDFAIAGVFLLAYFCTDRQIASALAGFRWPVGIAFELSGILIVRMATKSRT